MRLTRKNKTGQLGLLALAAVFFIGQGPAFARPNDSTEEIINLLLEKNIITSAEADRILSRHRETGNETGAENVTVVVPRGERYLKTITENVARDIKEDVTRKVKLEIKDEIANEVKLEAYTGSVPGWTKRIRFGGDIRLRYQGDYFDDNNVDVIDPSDPTEIMNRNIDRQRLRYRARVTVKAQVNNQTEVGLRLATGNEDDPISTNDTLGDYMNKDTVTFDQAYLKWTPIPETSTWTGRLDFWGGRIPNPFFSTDLVWDRDLNFEGVAANLEMPVNTRLKGFLNGGVFPLDEIDLSSQDKWLYGGQLGVEYAPRTNLSFTLAAAYYDYRNIKGKRNDPALVVGGEGPNDYTVPLYQQSGNVIFDINESTSGSTKFALAADYEELNITAEMNIGFFDPIYITFLADYVKNIGFDRDEVEALTGESVPEEDTGYQVGITVGYPKIKKLWDWQTSLFYRYLEADAVVDAFTDSDFHLGGTNAKGWLLSGQLGLGKNFWLKARWLSADETSGPPIAVDVLQVDVNSRF